MVEATPPDPFRADPLPQDWGAIQRWAQSQGLRLSLPQPPRQFAGGLANLNYLVAVDGKPAVLRRPPSGALAHGASDMQREARVLSALAPMFALAPRALAFCADASVLGVPFQLIEWRPGIAIGGSLPTGMAAAESGWLVDALCGALAALHAIDTGLPEIAVLGRPTGFAERQLRGWERRAAQAFGESAPEMLGQLVDLLGRSMPADAAARVLHMDAKFDNLLIDPERRSATAMIDWDMGTLGPPAFDLAVLLSYWIEPSDPPPTHALNAVPSLVPGWLGRAAVVAAYGSAAGGAPADLGWYLGLARLRLATAWMQLYRLWQQGRLAGPRYAGFETIACAILSQALDQSGEFA